MKNYFECLEYDKILKRLAKYTCFEESYNMAINLKPHFDLDIVKSEMQKTADAFKLAVRYGAPSFKAFINPQASIKRLKLGGALNFSELINIGNVLKYARLIKEWKKESSTVTSLDSFFEDLITNRDLENLIFETIISDDQISDNASEELFNIRQSIKMNYSKAREEINHIIKNQKYQKYLQDNVVTMREERFVIPVKSEYKSEIDGIVHDTSSSGSTLFIEPNKIVQINNKIKILFRREKQEIERILLILSQKCSEFSEFILSDFKIMVHLNLYFAKTELAIEMNAFVPEINDQGKIDLHGARNPLIEKDKVVPINLRLGYDYKCLIITGPNTGGKTAALKTLGILTLMTMCGLMIPACEGSTISIFNNILVDIGDEQSIQLNLSTFSAHMTNIIDILNRVDDSTLILLDELGSGTDPIEGEALAISIIEHINKKNCVSLITTHYSKLKKYAVESDDVENASFEFDLKNLRPTYNLLIGLPGKSNAFFIAQKLGLFNEIIDNARKIVSNDNMRFEDVVSKLNDQRIKYEKLNEELLIKQEFINKSELEVKQFKEKMDIIKQKEIDAAQKKASQIVCSVKSEAEKLFKELEELRKRSSSSQSFTNSDISGFKRKINILYDKSDPVIEKTVDANYVLPRKLKIGDNILIRDIDKKAVVMTLPDKSGNFFAKIGIIKTRVKVDNIILLKNEKVSFQGSVMKDIKSVSDRAVSKEIDLRGYVVEEALIFLDRFIDNSVILKMNEISIIHGKGSGALRTAVQKHLKRHKNIQSYRIGTFGEGESGVTIAALK